MGSPIAARVTGVERRVASTSKRPYLAVEFEAETGERLYANYVLDHPIGLEGLERAKAAVRGRRCRLVVRPWNGRSGEFKQVIEVLPPVSGWRRIAINGLRAGTRLGVYVTAGLEVAAQMLEERA